MSCYNHPDVAASSSCCYCGKYLCRSCQDFIQERSVCQSETCKVELTTLNRINDVAARLYNLKGEKKKAIPYTAIAFIIAGLFIVGYDIYNQTYHYSYLTIMLGLLFIILGIIMSIRAYKYNMNIW